MYGQNSSSNPRHSAGSMLSSNKLNVAMESSLPLDDVSMQTLQCLGIFHDFSSQALMKEAQPTGRFLPWHRPKGLVALRRIQRAAMQQAVLETRGDPRHETWKIDEDKTCNGRHHRKTIGKWWFNGGLMGFNGIYPLVNIERTMENHLV